MNNDFPNKNKIEGFALKYNLCLPERQRVSLIGELAGRRTGSSIEYQDRRNYVPGDDVRHIDWRAFARNDRLTIKLYREEICPRVDIIIDTSASMAVTPEKLQCRLDMAYFFFLLSKKINAATRIFSLGNRLDDIGSPLDLLSIPHSRQDSPLHLLKNAPVSRTGGVKIIISDLLFPFSPSEICSLFSNADRLVFIQILSAFENNPQQIGRLRLIDAEDDEFIDLALDKNTINSYKSRLSNLQGDLERRLRTMDGALASFSDDLSTDQLINPLLHKQIIGA